jgi:hypothetical protein
MDSDVHGVPIDLKSGIPVCEADAGDFASSTNLIVP